MMTNTRSLIVVVICTISVLSYNSLQAQEQPVQQEQHSNPLSPTKWDLQACIDYALQKNISIRKNRINALSSLIDVKLAKAALFPSLSFSTSQNMVNRPYQESSSTVSGTEILKNNSKTSYNGNYGLNASWTLFNGKRLKTIEQQKINSQVAELDVATSENDIEQSIAQAYMQILYATESVRVNESTLKVSQAQRDRGKELLSAGSIAKSDLAQLESQVSNDRYLLVTAQATLQDYKLQLKQLLELDGEQEMQIFIPELDNQNVFIPLPTKSDVFHHALAIRPEIEAGKLNVQVAELNIDIAKSGYLPTLSLSAGIGTNNTSGNDFTFTEQLKNGWNNSLGLTLRMPIFDNRQTKSTIQKARLQRETNMLALLDEQKVLYKTIEGLWLDANNAQQQYAAASDKLQSAQTSYDLISEQFDLGMKNTVELLTEKNNLLQAKQEQLQAKYMAILNILLLKFYQGDNIAL